MKIGRHGLPGAKISFRQPKQRAGKEGVVNPLITQVLFLYNLSFFKNTRILRTFKKPLTPFPVTKIELRPIGKRSLE